jgi:hypothetical protein
MSEPPPKDPSQPPRSPGNGRLIPDLVSRVLGYMDRPWKAVAVILILIIGALGWGSWQERERLAQLLAVPERVSLNHGALPTALATALVETGADIVAVWSLDLAANAAYFEQGRRRGGGPWTFAPARVPAITPGGNVKLFADLLAGHAVCDGHGNVSSLMTRAMTEANVQRFCFVPIRDMESAVFGILLLAWYQSPDTAHEAAALGTGAEIAASLVTR